MGAMRWLAASLVAGLALGAGGRAVMWIVALAAGIPPAFSVGGSLEVVATGVAIGAPAAMAYFLLQSRLRHPRIWLGLVAGGVTFGVVRVLLPPAARSAIAATPVSPVVVGGLFAILFTGFGALLDLIWRRAARYGGAT